MQRFGNNNAMRRSSRVGLGATALLALLLAGCQRTYFWAINVGRGDDPPQAVAYLPQHRLLLDIHAPVLPAGSTKAAPVVIYFYGGSWRDGRREDHRFVGAALAKRGVLVLMPDYRKAPAHPFPAFMEDAAAATAWARTHAASLGGDPEQIFLMGHSAGAHIAALLAADARYLKAVDMAPRDLAGVIGLAGPYDFLPITDPKIRAVFGNPAHWPQSQPVNFINGDEPPFLLLHGSDDRLVWPMNSERLAAKLRSVDRPVTLLIVPGIGHVRLLNGFLSPRFSPALEESLRWMERHAQRQP